MEENKELHTDPAAEQAAQPQPEQAEVQKDDKKAKHHAELAAAKAHAEELEKQLSAAKEQLLRTAAEYENFRKRSAKEHDGAFNNGVGFAVDRLLPVLDTLKLAAAAETADENYKKGVLLTMDKCAEAFKLMGVSEMEAEGKPFDPELHAAVLQQPAPEGVESGTVLQVLQTGYLLGEKVLRHATVIVAE